MMVQLGINHKYLNGAGVIDEGTSHGRSNVNLQHCQITNLQSGNTDIEE